jgi:hypothetical protein
VHHAAPVRQEYIKLAQIDQGKFRHVLAGEWQVASGEWRVRIRTVALPEPSIPGQAADAHTLNADSLNTYSLSRRIVAGTSS